jgi:hypothetical protein
VKRQIGVKPSGYEAPVKGRNSQPIDTLLAYPGLNGESELVPGPVPMSGVIG